MKKLVVLSFVFLLIGSGMIWAEDPSVMVFKPALGGAHCELVTPQGMRIYIDISHEGLLSTPPTEKDILLTTHGHHSCNLINTFPGEQLRGVGEIKRQDVHVRCITGAHLPGDKLTETDGTNYIFIIDIAGIRFAHFGGMGQDVFTPYQLKALGQVDVAFMILGSQASLADDFNLKAFNLMKQLKPKMIISTHYTLDTAKYGVKIYESYYGDKNTIQIRSNDLRSPKTKLLFLGEGAGPIAKITKVPLWPQ